MSLSSDCHVFNNAQPRAFSPVPSAFVLSRSAIISSLLFPRLFRSPGARFARLPGTVDQASLRYGDEGSLSVDTLGTTGDYGD